MSHLETLEAVSVLSFLPYGVHGFVNDLSTLSVVAFSIAIACAALAKDHVIGAEELSDRRCSHTVDDSRLEVDEDGSGHIAASVSFIVVHINSLKLEIRVTMVGTGWVNSMFVRDDFPEFGTDLVTALTSLNVNDFSHCVFCSVKFSNKL